VLDGIVEGSGAVFEAKFMLPWTFSEEAAAEKHMAQLQHNMWVTASRTAVLSIITGGGQWVEMTIPADPLYQHLLLTAEKKFWHCVERGETPGAPGSGAPKKNRNAFKHGLFTRGAIEQRKQVQALIGQSRKLLQDIE
jgi:predicted phage-related endonuclease